MGNGQTRGSFLTIFAQQISILSHYIKSILGVFAVILIAHAFMPFLMHEGRQFDPTDENDHAIFKQRTNRMVKYQGSAVTLIQQKDFDNGGSNHQSQKKIKIKHVSFQIALNSNGVQVTAEERKDACEAVLRRDYSFQFYKEINPPPPKGV